jgi:hypothetical protein
MSNNNLQKLISFSPRIFFVCCVLVAIVCSLATAITIDSIRQERVSNNEATAHAACEDMQIDAKSRTSKSRAEQLEVPKSVMQMRRMLASNDAQSLVLDMRERFSRWDKTDAEQAIREVNNGNAMLLLYLYAQAFDAHSKSTYQPHHWAFLQRLFECEMDLCRKNPNLALSCTSLSTAMACGYLVDFISQKDMFKAKLWTKEMQTYLPKYLITVSNDMKQ